MARYRPFEPNEEDLPEGWEPEQDRDARWEGIVELMKQSDDPEMPPQATFDAIRLQARRQAIDEGFLKLPEERHAHSGEITFGHWLRLLFTGGGAGAQVVRMGFVGAVAFALALSYDTPREDQTASGDGGAPEEIASNNEVQEQQAPANEINEQAAAAEVEKGPSAQPVAQKTPVGSTVGESTELASGGEGTSVPRSIHDLSNESHEWGYRPPVSRSGNSSQTIPVGASYGNNANKQSLATQALDRLQVLKFNSMVNQDERNLAELRQLERIIAQMVTDVQSTSVPETEAIRQYRTGEQLVSAQRFSKAQQAFERVTQIYPGSSLAFLARFQIGAIAFERTQDYDLALESFRRCLEEYGTNKIPARHRKYLKDRVKVLEETKSEQWETLKTWQSIDKREGRQETMEQLLSLLDNTSSSFLATEAGVQLKELLLADSVRRELDAQRAVEALRKRVAGQEPGAETARLQFSLAEIIARRVRNASEAANAYRKALELGADQETQALIQSRLAHLKPSSQ